MSLYAREITISTSEIKYLFNGFRLKKRQQFALQIQMVEVMMLQEMVRFAQQENIGIRAIKHDAILLDEKIDHRDMEDHVKNVISLNIRIGEERIE